MSRNFKYGYLELDINKKLFYTDNDGKIITEEWRDIPDYEGYYQVSNCGRVKSLERKWKKKTFIMSQRIGDKGYPSAGMCINNCVKNRSVHQIMMMAFR